MNTGRLILILVAVLMCFTRWAASATIRIGDPVTPVPAIGADAQTYFGPSEESPLRPRPASLDDPLGTLYTAGTTWYDYQHNGSSGKMISVDNSGYVQMVWTKGMTSTPGGDRRIYYNVWDPTTLSMLFAGGTQVDGGTRAGFTCQGLLPSGWDFPAYHESRVGITGIHATGAMQGLLHSGAFAGTQPAFIIENGVVLQFVWPKIAVGADSTVHMVSTETTTTGVGPFRIYYSRGIPSWDDQGNGVQIDWQTVAPGPLQFMYIDTVYTVNADVAAAKTSDRVAVVWARARDNTGTQYNNDLYMMLSEDGGLNWGPHVNITNFAAEDTFRLFSDVSVMFDAANLLHIAFTTGYYNQPGGTYTTQKAMIWHWSEQYQQFNPMAIAWYESLTASVGAFQMMVHRPSLSQDATTGYLYSSYQQYDTTAYSIGGFFQGDGFITVSTDGGRHWSVGRNVTATHPVTVPTPAGSCVSERDITLADRVTYAAGEGYLSMAYNLDLDAGAAVRAPAEGTVTNNSVYFQRIPVDSIPHTPLMPFYSLHLAGSPIAPITTIYPVATGMRLLWSNQGMPYYKVYSSATASGDFLTLETTTPDTFYIDTAAPDARKFYFVRSSTAP